jgi:hypothetical protein
MTYFIFFFIITMIKITEWTPYKRRPVGRPRLRWMDQVEEDLKRMRITGWRVKEEDREEWSRIVEQTKTPQGCRVDRRRRRMLGSVNISKSVVFYSCDAVYGACDLSAPSV